MATSSQFANVRATENRQLDSRLESIGWALFLILLGGIWLTPFPSEAFLEGTFLAGVGLILLGLNLARFLAGIKVRPFGIALGLLALITGASAFGGLHLPFWPILLVLIGVYILLRPVLEK